MPYKLSEEDKLCGVTYFDVDKHYSPIPKATCEMIQPKCSSGGGGGSYDDSVELKCEDLKKLIHGEDKPKEDKPKEDTPNEGNKEETPKENETPTEDKHQENPKEEETPKENNTPGENNTPREENPSDNVGGNPTEDNGKPTTEDKPTTDEVTPKENEPSPSPRVEDTPRTEETPAEPTPEPPVSDTPTEGNASDHLGDTSTEGNQEVNLLELMPEVKDKFSSITFENNVVRDMSEESTEEKRAFERGIITTLKSKLPEGAVVEAVLGEPYYTVGKEYNEEKTNYTLNVRVTLNEKVYEQEYNVPYKIVVLTGYVDNI